MTPSHEEDIGALRKAGRSKDESERAAHALALCDAWLASTAPHASAPTLDRVACFKRMERWKRTPAATWGGEATSALVALAMDASLRLTPLSVDQIALRNAHRASVRDAILATINSIEQKSGRSGFAKLAATVELDAAIGFDTVMTDPWSCIGQVPISSEQFETLRSSIVALRDAAALEAATKLAALMPEREYPNISADAVADVLRDGLNSYARAAFVDGFAGRGSPLRFDGFNGEIAGRLCAIRLQPAGNLPRLPQGRLPSSSNEEGE